MCSPLLAAQEVASRQHLTCRKDNQVPRKVQGSEVQSPLKATLFDLGSLSVCKILSRSRELYQQENGQNYYLAQAVDKFDGVALMFIGRANNRASLLSSC